MNAIRAKENYLESLYELLDDCESDSSTHPEYITNLKKEIEEVEQLLDDMYQGL